MAPLPASREPAPVATDGVHPPAGGFHGAVSEFKRRLIEATLRQLGGNRTRAARALGLQRTYLLRLMREFQIQVPPPPTPGRRGPANGGEPPGQTR
jgi:DNA-binding NtrC family response regulator